MRIRITLFALFMMLAAAAVLAADTEPPVFVARPTASPDVLSPVNGELVPVKVSFEVKDNADPQPRCAIRNVWSDDPISADDWKITGDSEVALRATVTTEHDRIYHATVICTDSSGNEAGDAAIVRVPAPPSKADQPPVIEKLHATPDVLSPVNDELVPVTISAEVTDDYDPKPRCGIMQVWSDDPISADDWKISGDYDVSLRASVKTEHDRIYHVTLLCSDSAGNQSGNDAIVRVPAPPSTADQPPVLTRLSASPNVLSPANGEMVPVKIDVGVVDDYDSNPRCAIRNVWSDDEISADDWKITGDFEVALRATVKTDHDRIYNVTVICTDSAGNEAGNHAIVRVPVPESKVDHPPVIAKLTATPDTLTPALGELVPVKVSVEVVDDYDPQPRCAIRNVWSDDPISADDWKITGDLDLLLRAKVDTDHDRIYHVTVVCGDSAGNESGSDALVRVPVSPLDTSAPVLLKLTSTSTAAPPNSDMVPVQVSVEVTDDTDPEPRCAISSIWSSQALNAGDWKQTGDLAVALRAPGVGAAERTYALSVVCSDFSGNQASQVLTVRVANGAQSAAPAPPPPSKRRSSRS